MRRGHYSRVLSQCFPRLSASLLGATAVPKGVCLQDTPLLGLIWHPFSPLTPPGLAVLHTAVTPCTLAYTFLNILI